MNQGFEREPLKLKIGSIRTGFHSLSLKLRTSVDSFDDIPEDSELSKDSERSISNNRNSVFASPPPRTRRMVQTHIHHVK